MEWMDVVGSVVQSVFVGGVLFILMGLAANWLDVFKRQAKTKDLEANLLLIEEQVVTFIRAAEQKFNAVADVAEEFMTPDQKARFQDHRRKANADKKAYVLDLAKQAFPDMDVKYIDAMIEGIYNAYKESKERAAKEVRG